MSDLARYRLEVASALDTEFLHGRTRPDLSSFEEPLLLRPDEGLVDLSLVEDLIGHALSLDFSEKTQLDGWLAPRLHNALRIPRETASDRGFWAWLAINSCGPYVRFRWPDDTGEVSAWRYTGTLLRNAVARLWWGAELVRNGPSYSHVPTVFKRVRTAQWTLELKYSWFRPAAVAFVRIAEAVDGGRALSDDEMRALSKRINAYLTLTGLEAVAGLDTQGEPYDLDWRRHQPALQDLISDELPEGPSDGAVPEDAIACLEDWFRRLLDVHAPSSEKATA